MEALTTLLNLLAKTESRDKIIRVFQYATLHSVDHNPKGATFKVYQQMRRTRKILRFLRTLEFSSEIRKQVTSFSSAGSPSAILRKVLVILENLFNFLFFFADHRVVLAELGVIDGSNRDINYPRSMHMYFLQNVVGVIRNIVEMAIVIVDGKYDGELVDSQSGGKIIKRKAFDLLRCLLDTLVALHYWKGTITPQKAGIVGVITSFMGILQSLKVF